MMSTGVGQRQHARTPLEALRPALRGLAEGARSDEVFVAIVKAVAEATTAEAAILRVRDEEGFDARAVSAGSTAVMAEIQGSRLPPEPAADEALAAAAGALGLRVLVVEPVIAAGRLAGRLELLGQGSASSADEAFARIAADHAALAFKGTGGNGTATGALRARELLRLGGDALAAGLDEQRTAEQITLLAAQVTGALSAAVWRLEDGKVRLVGAYGTTEPDAAGVAEALDRRRPLVIDGAAWVLQLGQPAFGALQLRFEQSLVPGDDVLDALTTFAARAAHALQSSARAARQSVELERSRALITVVGQAISQLSLSHTLETAIARVAELLDVDRVAVYLIDDEGRVLDAAARGLAGPHTRVAERLLELARGPLRGQDAMTIADAQRDARLALVRDQVAEVGIEAAVGLPLRVHQELIGLLAVYPPRGRTLSGEPLALATALTAQLAVAVQNARLHEQVKRREAERYAALEAEQNAARTLRSLYEISRTFAQSLSLETTLEAVVRALAELLRIDAVGIRMPEERGAALVTQALHVRDERLADAVGAVLFRPQPFSPRLRRLFAGGRPLFLTPAVARELGGAYALLVPFLEKGSTTAIVPVSTPAEVLGTLTLLSLDPGRPLGADDIELAQSVVGQAALALENARLYQQQKRFADSMQRSLLPRAHPRVEGIEVGAVYESSARLDVGGDVYDFLALENGQLAVALGDVTGHGIDAAADMAMAKFVFRSLAREHPEPADFLAVANEVVLGEVGAMKFITMLYLTLDPKSGELACASAGHPWPRIVSPDGAVATVETTGLALGIEPGQNYAAVRRQLQPRSAVVLYTDGVVEARAGAEFYGDKRLDDVLAANAGAAAEDLARAVVDDCRAFTGGELLDDCAVVVVRRVG